MSYGFVNDIFNLYENAKIHLDKEYVLNIDLEDFSILLPLTEYMVILKKYFIKIKRLILKYCFI